LKPEYSVSWLPWFDKRRIAKLAQEGIDDLRNVPGESLNPLQLRVKTHTLANTVFFDTEAAAATLALYCSIGLGRVWILRLKTPSLYLWS
jgi:hypothetical protein